MSCVANVLMCTAMLVPPPSCVKLSKFIRFIRETIRAVVIICLHPFITTVPLLSIGDISAASIYYTAVRRQNVLTLILEFVEESDFNSDAAYHSAYLSDVQSMIAKKFVATSIWVNFFNTR